MISPALTLVLIVAVAYLAAHLVFDWVAKRYLIVSGTEYLVLGLLLGPQVSGVLSVEVIQSFAPLTTLAIGWMGAAVGMQFQLRQLVGIPGLSYRLAFLQSLATLAAVAGIEYFVFFALFDLPPQRALVPALALGAIAVASAPAGIEVVARRLGRRQAVVRQLQLTSAIDSLVAVLAFGLLLCLAHPAPAAGGREPTATEWMVISLGIGVIAGALFYLFLGGERKVDRLVIALGGAIILTSGAAAYLELSPLLAAMTVGVMLVNTSSNRQEIARTLASGERAFYFVLLVFAGASWEPSLREWYVAPVVLFLLARAAGKIGGARLASRAAGVMPVLGSNWGRALLGQGVLALAIGLEYIARDTAEVPNIVFTAVIASVLLTDLMSARLVRSVVEPLLPGDARPRPSRETLGAVSAGERAALDADAAADAAVVAGAADHVTTLELAGDAVADDAPPPRARRPGIRGRRRSDEPG